MTPVHRVGNSRSDTPRSLEARENSVRGPVSRVLSPPASAGDGHSSRMPVTGHLARPTRAADPEMKPAGKPTCCPYLVLLPVGFTLPPPLPAARCALTAPFHPCPHTTARQRFAFCGTFPEVALAGRYPAPYLRGARTFLPHGTTFHGGDHPAV